MSSAFMETSKDIAKDFVQSILFVDDKAYGEDQGDHPFDVKKMVKESAARGLIATVYAPEHQNDLERVVEVGRKADVIVLDWRIDIHEDPDQEQGDEEDDEDAEFRGTFAIDVINNLIDEGSDPIEQLKLIYIYTGETGLLDIFTRLNNKLSGFETSDNFTLSRGGIRISIWAKDSIASSFTHTPENKARLRSYEQLLDEIPTEYAKISSGLLSNACLGALTALRKNTYKLLGCFSPTLDPAFVAHRAMLPRPEDAGDLLRETICGELNSILANDNISKYVSSDSVEDWLESSVFTDKHIKVHGNKKITINDEKRKLWQHEGCKEMLSREVDASGGQAFDEKQIESFEKNKLLDNACLVFRPEGHTADTYNEDFSILTHHKNNYLSTIQPSYLTLGVMVQDEEGNFYICIQQKCDSLRIPDGEKRNFLFLPMNPSKSKVDVILKEESTGSYLYLSACYAGCYALKVVEFLSAVEGSGIVDAQIEEESFYFSDTSSPKKKYKWILELKEAHAQRIANNYASKLSRVGLDESEWLRRT